ASGAWSRTSFSRGGWRRLRTLVIPPHPAPRRQRRLLKGSASEARSAGNQRPAPGRGRARRCGRARVWNRSEQRRRLRAGQPGGGPGAPEAIFPGARPPALVDRNESHGGRVYRPEVMGETTLSRLYCRWRFPMRRFLVLALVGALGLAGGTGLAFGENARPQTPSKPQAKKVSPPASPGKH